MRKMIIAIATALSLTTGAASAQENPVNQDFVQLATLLLDSVETTHTAAEAYTIAVDVVIEQRTAGHVPQTSLEDLLRRHNELAVALEHGTAAAEAALQTAIMWSTDCDPNLYSIQICLGRVETVVLTAELVLGILEANANLALNLMLSEHLLSEEAL